MTAAGWIKPDSRIHMLTVNLIPLQSRIPAKALQALLSKQVVMHSLKYFPLNKKQGKLI